MSTANDIDDNEERMQRIVAIVQGLVARDDGQDLMEYGLLVVLIAVVAMVAVTAVGVRIDTVLWQAIANNF